MVATTHTAAATVRPVMTASTRLWTNPTAREYVAAKAPPRTAAFVSAGRDEKPAERQLPSAAARIDMGPGLYADSTTFRVQAHVVVTSR